MPLATAVVALETDLRKSREVIKNSSCVTPRPRVTPIELAGILDGNQRGIDIKQKCLLSRGAILRIASDP